MRQPPAVYFTTQEHALWLDLSGVVVLFLDNPIINADVCSIPVTFLDVDDGVHIVFVSLYTQVPPNFAKSLNVALVAVVEPVLVLYLEKNNRTSVAGEVGENDVDQGLEIYLCLLQKCRIVLSDFDSRGRIKEPGW